MSNNYDMIATVDIDLESPIVDNTSFGNLLIMGPAPKRNANTPDVGVYSDISEVEGAGFVVSGKDADPVGVAASVAFAQSPRPTSVYIAVQKLSASAVIAAKTIEDVNAYTKQHIGTNEGITGCTVAYNADARALSVVLNGAISNAKNTGIFDVVAAANENGYVCSVEGQPFTDNKTFFATAVGKELMKLAQGNDAKSFMVKIGNKDGNEVTYQVKVSYPSGEEVAAHADEPMYPADHPDQELEAPAVTIARALSMSGWYVLCTAGVDPAKYEEIAAYIETQTKMFVYTELDCFPAPGTKREDGEDLVKPSVGSVYFRTVGVYGRVKTSQVDEDIPAANRYINVAFAAKWLNYPSGSETSAFKTLASVYPSELESSEKKALDDKNLCYFVPVGNKNITMRGITVAGEWADIIRFRDWLQNDMQLRVVNLFVTSPKIPYTDNGIALVQNQMIAALKAGQDAGGIAESEFDEDGNEIPGFQTSVPLSSSLTASEKASRKLKKCKFKARLAGAIHFAELKGSLTYTL